VFQLLYKTVVLSVVCVYIVDVRQGYCYYRLANDGRCLQHSDRIVAVTQSACCCTGGAAWGPKCEKCPAVGTGI